MHQNEKIIETKICKKCSAKFEITDKDLEFYEKISPIFSGKKYLIPSPTLCPDCRQQRRLAFRNESKIYKRKSDLSKKEIISIYSPDKPYKVYSQEEWWSDSWNALDYGRDFDFSRSFFEQFGELMKEVPRVALYGNNNENSDYTNDTTNNKNCYLVFASDFNEDCYYGIFNDSKNSIDCLESWYVENCYECVNCSNSFSLFYSIESKNCKNSSFLINCENCEECFLCSNLVNKKYCFLNKEYSKKEYEKKIGNIKLFEAKNEFQKLRKKSFYRNLNIINSENCFGNYIKNSKDCYLCFDLYDGENCSYIFFGSQKLKDCMDCIGSSINASLCYQVNTCLENCHSIIGCNFSNNIQNSYYSDSCINCKDCFGCIGLCNKQYCILNKQYSKEQYEKLVPKIIEKMIETGEWGNFFPSIISPFGYNETATNEYFPLTKEEAKKEGFNWSDYETPLPKVSKIIDAKLLPENISDIPDDILNRAIKCEITGRPFLIISQELEFYRKHNLPIPKRHPDQRHLDRMKQRNPRKLFDRKCDKCKKDIKTTYSPEKPDIVYCEECYNKAIY